MKPSSASARAPEPAALPRVVDRPTAWAYLVTNVATLPGLGTIAAGQRKGYVQAAIALAGFVTTFLGLIDIIRDWMAQGELPLGFSRGLLIGLAGVFVFGFAWLWALFTSLGLLRRATPANGRAPRGAP